MKAVLYHADAKYGERHSPQLYKHLIEELKKNLHSLNVSLVHVSVTGHEGWGDENYFYDVDDVQEVIYNREKCFLNFIREDANDNEIYWFCEPDSRMFKEFPTLTTDLALLYRDDPVKITPAWRLAKKSALPFFEEAFKHFNQNNKEWDGDSPAWIEMWKQLGSPIQRFDETKVYNWNNLSVELRPYVWYASRNRCVYSGQWKGGSKMELVTQEYKNNLNI